MPYVERVTKAGKTIEIEKYYTSRYGSKGQKRKDQAKATPEQQKKVNSRNAERKLRLLINENFTQDDLHVVLGYKRAVGAPHRTREEMREDIRKFLRLLRTEYKKIGKELKYIHVMEIGKKGAKHHHLVINEIDIKIIRKLWNEHGRPQCYPLDDSGQYKKLAAYLIKYTDKTVGTDEALQGKRWNPSKNLRYPEPEYTVVSNRAFYRAEAKVPHKWAKDYYVDQETIAVGVDSCEYSGYGYFRYTIVKKE